MCLVDADRKAICKMPMIRGDCDQQISRWYFNPADQYCHPFQYTGCRTWSLFNHHLSHWTLLDGNANAFETEQDCRELCQAKEKGPRSRKHFSPLLPSLLQMSVHWTKTQAVAISTRSCGTMMHLVNSARTSTTGHVEATAIVSAPSKNVKSVV